MKAINTWISSLDGSSADVDVGANDTATQVVNAAGDAVENFDGMSGDAEIGADDQASPVIDSVRDKAESWAGSFFNATIGIIDNVTVPIQSVLRAASNPIVQGASLLGVSLGVVDAVDTFKDFEAVMSQVKAISGATGQEFEDLTVKQSIKSMTNSQEWKEEDFFGRVDIAWNKIIAEPFTNWAGSEGKSLLSQGIGRLFSSATTILPGGEKAGLTGWLSAGLVGVGASKLISGGKNVASALAPIGSAVKNIASAASKADTIGGFFTSLTSMTSKAGMIGLGATAIATAIAGIVVAVDNYNSKVLNDNLEKHFGKIKLSAKEVEEIASGILDQKYLANVEFALNEVKNADSMMEAAQKALESNDVLEFKSRVGITLTPEERDDYTNNIETFVESKIEELQSRTFAAHIHVQTYIGGTKEGDTLAKNIEEWARADNLELTNLSNDLQTAVEKALTDALPEKGILSRTGGWIDT